MPAVVRNATGPRISVIVPTYNRAHLLPRAIDSVLRAVSPGDEVIVVDDGSTDGTERITERYSEKIRYVRTENRGAGPARNLGIQMANHDWIAFLDSDDEWMPDHLDLHRAFHSACDVPFSFSNFDVHYDQSPDKAPGRMKLVSWTRDSRSWDEILGKGVPYSQFAELPAARKDFTVHIGSLRPVMWRTSYVPTVTSLVRRDLVGERLRFPEDLPTYEDYECYIGLSNLGKAAYLDCSTAINHGHGGPRISEVNRWTSVTTLLTILERNWGSDTEFLRSNRGKYESCRNELKKIQVKQMILRGDTKRARQEFREIKNLPLYIRILGFLPGFAVRIMSQFYNFVRDGGKKIST